MRHWSHIQHKRSTFISEISVRAGSRPISLLCGIHHTIKITLVQSVPPAMCFASAYSVPRERKKKKEKKPSAGHHFHWQLVNKLKQRDAGTLFLPLLTLFLSPSSAVGNWCFPPKKSSWKWCPFQVVQLVEGIYHSSGLHGKDFLLHFTPSIHFCSCSPPLWFHWDGKSSE